MIFKLTAAGMAAVLVTPAVGAPMTALQKKGTEDPMAYQCVTIYGQMAPSPRLAHLWSMCTEDPIRPSENAVEHEHAETSTSSATALLLEDARRVTQAAHAGDGVAAQRPGLGAPLVQYGTGLSLARVVEGDGTPDRFYLHVDAPGLGALHGAPTFTLVTNSTSPST